MRPESKQLNFLELNGIPGQTHVISDNTLVINNFNNFLLITF